MSGGSFDYAYSHAERFSEELVLKVEANGKPNRCGDVKSLPEAVLNELLAIAEEARRLAKRMRAAEWLYSGDIGEDTFLRWVAESRQP